jgi:hypothetical protein
MFRPSLHKGVHNVSRMSLGSVTRGVPPLPPRIIVYGPHGIGKTTFGANAPDPIVLPTEDGLGTLDVPAFPLARSYEDVVNAIGALYQEAHSYRTFILDTIDWLEPLVWERTALLGGKDHIEDFGYGKGFLHADDQWKEILDGLNALRTEKGMTVILLAHAEIKRFDSPETDPYDRYQIKLHKRASEKLQEWADIIGFAHYEVHVVSTETGFNKEVRRGAGIGRRILSVEERPAYHAKNRYTLPADLDFTWDALANACAAAYTRPTGIPVTPAVSLEPSTPASTPAAEASVATTEDAAAEDAEQMSVGEEQDMRVSA